MRKAMITVLTVLMLGAGIAVPASAADEADTLVLTEYVDTRPERAGRNTEGDSESPETAVSPEEKTEKESQKFSQQNSQKETQDDAEKKDVKKNEKKDEVADKKTESETSVKDTEEKSEREPEKESKTDSEEPDADPEKEQEEEAEPVEEPEPPSIEDAEGFSRLSAESQEVLRKCEATWGDEVTDERRAIIEGAVAVSGVSYSMGMRNSPSVENPQYLDCSSFVGQAYWRSGLYDQSVAYWYTGLFAQEFDQIDESEVLPGDIAQRSWNPGGSGSSEHVGIYIGTVDGTKYYIHCSDYGVVAVDYSDFHYFGRSPELQQE